MNEHNLPDHRADFRFVPSQWETSFQSNAVSHWLHTNLESALWTHFWVDETICVGHVWWEKRASGQGITMGHLLILVVFLAKKMPAWWTLQLGLGSQTAVFCMKLQHFKLQAVKWTAYSWKCYKFMRERSGSCCEIIETANIYYCASSK